jgi:hypothetical protein
MMSLQTKGGPLAKVNRKAQARLEARRKLFDAMEDQQGFNRPGSMNRKKSMSLKS